MARKYLSGIARGFAGLAMGLGSVVSSNGCGVKLGTEGLPSGEGRRIALYEGDLQEAPNQELSFMLFEGDATANQRIGAIVTPLKDSDGESAPYDVLIRSGTIREGEPVQYFLVFKDNDKPFVNGRQDRVRIQGTTDFGLNLYGRNPLNSCPEFITVEYNKGKGGF